MLVRPSVHMQIAIIPIFVFKKLHSQKSIYILFAGCKIYDQYLMTLKLPAIVRLMYCIDNVYVSYLQTYCIIRAN